HSALPGQRSRGLRSSLVLSRWAVYRGGSCRYPDRQVCVRLVPSTTRVGASSTIRRPGCGTERRPRSSTMVSARLADRFSNHHEERSATVGPASREMPGTTVGKCFPYPDGRRRLSVVACFP